MIIIKNIANTLFSTLLFTLFFTLLMTSTAFASNVGDTFGISPEAMGLGNAVTARVNDWSSPYYNIAGLGKTGLEDETKNQIGVAIINNFPSFDIDINRPGVNGDKNLKTGTIVVGGVLDAGLLLNIPFVSSSRAGILLAMNDDFSAVSINDLDPRTHNFMRYGRESQRLVVMGGFGVGFNDDMFGFGFGVNSSFAGDGNVAMSGVVVGTDPQNPPGQAKMNMEIEQNFLVGFYFTPMEGLEFGLSYKEETILNIYPFNTVATTDLGGVNLNLILALTDYYYPETITLGTACEFSKLKFSFDLEMQNWSGFKMSVPMTTNYGSEFKKFDDIIVPKFGLQYQVDSRLDLLSGYYYQPSFISKDSLAGELNMLDNEKHVLSTGFSWKLPRVSLVKADMVLSGSYQYQMLMKRDATKTTPTALNPNYSFKGTCHSFMIGITLNI